MQSKKQKQYKKGFICSKNNFQLVCQFQPLSSKLVLAMFLQNNEKLIGHSSSTSSTASLYYFSKQYSDQQCKFSTDPFSMIFQTLQQFYLHLLKNKQQDTINLRQGCIQIQLELFNKKVTKTLQFKKSIHSRIQRYLLKTKKIVDKKYKEEMDKSSILLQNLFQKSQQFQMSQKEYLITIDKFNKQSQRLLLELNQLKARLSIFQQVYEQQKRFYQTKINYLESLLSQQEEANRRRNFSIQNQENQEYLVFDQDQNKNIEEQNYNNAVNKAIKQQLIESPAQFPKKMCINILKKCGINKFKAQISIQQKQNQAQQNFIILQEEQRVQQNHQYSQSQQSIKQESDQIDKYLNKYLQEQMKSLKNKIKYKSEFKLNLSGHIPILAIQFCKDINFVIQTLKAIQEINLKKNNICDDGWQCLVKINLPKLNQLSVSDNNLKNITFNSEVIQNLSCLCLSDNRRMGSYPNTLTQTSLKKMLNCKWENIKQLSVDFKVYNQFEQLRQNFELWNTFIQNKFGSFPFLQILYYGTCHISSLTILKLREVCNELRPRNIILKDSYRKV